MTQHILLNRYDSSLPNDSKSRNARISQFATAKQQNVTPVANLCAFAVNDLVKRARKAGGAAAAENPTTYFLEKKRKWRPLTKQTATVPADAAGYKAPLAKLPKSAGDLAAPAVTVGLELPPEMLRRMAMWNAAVKDGGSGAAGGSRYFQDLSLDADRSAAFHRMHELDPHNCEAWIAHAEFLAKKKEPLEPQQALHILAAAVEFNPAERALWEAYICLFAELKPEKDTLEMAAVACAWAPSFALWTVRRNKARRATDRITVAANAMEWRLSSAAAAAAADAGASASTGGNVYDPRVVSMQVLELVLFVARLEAERGNVAGACATVAVAVGASIARTTSHESILGPLKSRIQHFLRKDELYMAWVVLAHLVAYNKVPDHLCEVAGLWRGTLVRHTPEETSFCWPLPPPPPSPSGAKGAAESSFSAGTGRGALMQADKILMEAIALSCGSTSSKFGNRSHKAGFAGLLFDHRIALHQACLHSGDPTSGLGSAVHTTRLLKDAAALCTAHPTDPILWLARIKLLSEAGEPKLEGTIRAAMSHGASPEFVCGIVKVVSVIAPQGAEQALAILVDFVDRFYEVDEDGEEDGEEDGDEDGEEDGEDDGDSSSDSDSDGDNGEFVNQRDRDGGCGQRCSQVAAEAARRYQRLMGITVADYDWKPPGAVSEMLQQSTLATPRARAFLRLCYCQLLELSPIFTQLQVLNAYEWSLTSVTTCSAQELLWSSYIEFRMRMGAYSGSASELLDVTKRCLMSVPTAVVPKTIGPGTLAVFRRLGRPSSVDMFDYSYFNCAFFFYLKLIPRHKWKDAYTEIRIRSTQDNVALNCHAALLEAKQGRPQHASMMLAAALESRQHVSVMWRFLIALELSAGRIAQARWLYNKVRGIFPSNRDLWREVNLFTHLSNPLVLHACPFSPPSPLPLLFNLSPHPPIPFPSHCPVILRESVCALSFYYSCCFYLCFQLFAVSVLSVYQVGCFCCAILSLLHLLLLLLFFFLFFSFLSFAFSFLRMSFSCLCARTLLRWFCCDIVAWYGSTCSNDLQALEFELQHGGQVCFV